MSKDEKIKALEKALTEMTRCHSVKTTLVRKADKRIAELDHELALALALAGDREAELGKQIAEFEQKPVNLYALSDALVSHERIVGIGPGEINACGMMRLTAALMTAWAAQRHMEYCDMDAWMTKQNKTNMDAL